MSEQVLAEAPSSEVNTTASIQFSIENAALSKALRMLSGVVDHAQVIQILGFIKCILEKDSLLMIASNSEIEMHVRVPISHDLTLTSDNVMAFTLPCKKLLDISRTLPNDAQLFIEQNNNWTAVKVGKTNFKLAALAVEGFPQITNFTSEANLEMSEAELQWLLRRTGFAMANQDVRFFLNGVLFKFSDKLIETVATDGHRLAKNALTHTQSIPNAQYILPKKTVQELSKHLQELDSVVQIDIASQHMRFTTENMVLYSNLIEGDYPDFDKLLPKNFSHSAKIDINTFKASLQKMITLANEKYHGAEFHFQTGNLGLTTHNINHEEAYDEIAIDFSGDAIKVGLNIHYVLEVLQVAETDNIQVGLTDADKSISFTEADSDNNSQFIIMPLTL